MNHLHHHNNPHSYHHKKPLGFSSNHYRKFDNMKPTEERLHPKVMKPFQGLKQVHKQYEAMHEIAPDFNSQTKTFSDGSAFPQKHALNSQRQSNTHLVNKRNDEFITMVVISAVCIGFCFIVKK